VLRIAAREMGAGAGTILAALRGMCTIEPARWDDYVLAALLLLVEVPRLVIALLHDRPLGVEGSLSMLFAALALGILVRRRR